MSKFKVGDWIVPKDEHERKFLKHFEPDVVWPTKVLAVICEGSFVKYKGGRLSRNCSRFKLAPPEKSLDDYM